MGAAVEIPNSSSAKGVQAFVGNSNNSPNQFWQFIPAKGKKDEYYIKSFCGKCLDVCEAKKVAGAKIIQYDYNGDKNQIWHIKEI